MEMPALIYGRYAEVGTRLRRAVTRLVRGETWAATLGVADTVDTKKADGLLVLNGPSPLLGGSPHFQCYLPLVMVSDAMHRGRLPREREEELFRDSLETYWGVLGLLSPANVLWVHSPERHFPLLRAVESIWEVLDNQGDRYSVGSTVGQRLWSMHSNLKYVLANHGIPTAVLNAPLPSGGLAALLPGEGD